MKKGRPEGTSNYIKIQLKELCDKLPQGTVVLVSRVWAERLCLVQKYEPETNKPETKEPEKSQKVDLKVIE